MPGDVIDMFFSFRGRIPRRTWLIGTAAVTAMAALGIFLFNNDNFDESANAVAGAPTMAAFFWAALCLVALSALCAKRLNAIGAPRALLAALAAPGAVLIGGWGLGYFQHPLTVDAETLAFWALLAAPLPALRACLRNDRNADA